MQDFRKLGVWKKAHRLTLAVYKFTAAFPTEERYGLTSQMRRCAVSIPSNIAEGCGRGSDADFARFLHIAMGSASELEYQLLLAYDLTFINEATYRTQTDQVNEIKRMLGGFLKKLTTDS